MIYSRPAYHAVIAFYCAFAITVGCSLVFQITRNRVSSVAIYHFMQRYSSDILIEVGTLGGVYVRLVTCIQEV